MSLAKAAFSGRVFREPQKRSTSNNLYITYFTFDIGTDNEEELIRVRALGNLAEIVEKTVSKDDMLVVEGNLMISTVKTETGEEKRIVDLSLSSFEKISKTSSDTQIKASTPAAATAQEEDIVKFSANPPEDLIGEDEIPF